MCTCGGDLNANELYLQCSKDAQSQLAQCFLGCDEEDANCTRDCSRAFEASLLNCPCAENCPVGCPCPIASDYCGEFVAKKGFDLLVLSTYDLSNDMGTKLLLDSEGNDKTKSGFRLGCFSGNFLYLLDYRTVLSNLDFSFKIPKIQNLNF